MRVTILFLLAGVATAFGDSVATTNHLTVYGHIEHMDQVELVLTAGFPSSTGVQTKPVAIPRNQILRIEFNASTFNPGGPPAIGARPANEHDSNKPPSAGQDVVVLPGGERKPCGSAAIDAGQKVHCGNAQYEERAVIRILLEPK
jgi:hypothetical protein